MVAMTTYLNTLVGQVTAVRPGLLSAILYDESEGGLAKGLSGSGERKLVGQPGSYLAIAQKGIRVLAMVTEMVEQDTLEPSSNLPGRRNVKQKTIKLIPLGEINSGGIFENGVKNYPTAGAEVHAVSEDDIKSIFVKFRSQGYSLGTLSNLTTLDVCFDPAALFGRHLAILGQSGAGKSWTVANLIQRAVKVMPNAHIIMLDLHGEYAWKDREGKQHYAFDENVVRHIDARDLEMPYWLMTFSELVDLFIDRTDDNASTQIAFLRDSVHDLRNKSNKALGISHLTVDSPVYFSLEELYGYFEEANKSTTNFGKEKGPLAGQFDQFLMRLESRMNDVRYNFMLKPSHRNSSDSLGGLLRDFVGLGDPKRPITVIDISTVPFDVRPTVTSQIGRLAFEFNYWNPHYRDFPILLVCEEAHAYIPRDNDPRYEGTRQSMQRIAREGRKYGVGLAVVSQRPNELSETVLAQCNTFICLRLTNPDDQAYVRNLVPEAERDLIEVLSSLGRGEALVMGQAVPLPTRLQFNKPNPVPNSSDVDFYNQWITGLKDLDVDDIVDRWRHQDRLKS
jgi:DNA helicase HerA-like ATPase